MSPGIPEVMVRIAPEPPRREIDCVACDTGKVLLVMTRYVEDQMRGRTRNEFSEWWGTCNGCGARVDLSTKRETWL